MVSFGEDVRVTGTVAYIGLRASRIPRQGAAHADSRRALALPWEDTRCAGLRASPARTARLQTGPAYGGLKAAYVNRRDHQPLSLDFADHHPEVANILHTLIPWNCWWCACALAQPPYRRIPPPLDPRVVAAVRARRSWMTSPFRSRSARIRFSTSIRSPPGALQPDCH